MAVSWSRAMYTVSTKRLLSSQLLKTDGVQMEHMECTTAIIELVQAGPIQWRACRTPYLSSNSSGLWVLGFAVSVHCKNMRRIMKHIKNACTATKNKHLLVFQCFSNSYGENAEMRFWMWNTAWYTLCVSETLLCVFHAPHVFTVYTFFRCRLNNPVLGKTFIEPFPWKVALRTCIENMHEIKTLPLTRLLINDGIFVNNFLNLLHKGVFGTSRKRQSKIRPQQ